MAEESPQNINPATDPQVEDPPATAVPASSVDVSPAPVAPASNPEVPQPTQQVELPTAPPPDEAFLEQQTAQENRWIQAAATNPEGIRDNGSVFIDKGGGVTEVINRDGSYEISSGEGTYRYDAAGQQTSYTTPTIGGLSVTTTADGVAFSRFSQGPLTTTTITKDGQPISTTTSLQGAGVGDPTVTETQVAGGEIVRSVSIIEPSDDPMARGTLVTAAQVGEGEIVTSTTTLQGRIQAREAALEANAENIKLREELIAAKQQTESGIPLSATQQAALEEQAQAAAAADADLAAAELAVAETDPTVVAPDTNPQVAEPFDTEPIPNLATTEVEPVPVTGDPEIQEFQAQQEAAEFVPVSEIDTGPAPLSAQEITEYEQLTAVNVNETGAQFQEPFVSEEARAAAGEFYAANPETIREIINSPPPPTVETQQEEIDLSLEELESRVAAGDEPEVVTTDPEVNELVAAEEAAEFVPVSEIDLAAADIDPADDPEVPQPVDDLPDAFVYDTADTIELDDDPIILAQAEATASDVALVDVTETPDIIGEDDPAAPETATPPEGGFYGEPTPVGGNYTAVYDPETGNYNVVDLDTGETVESGLSQQQATLAAEDLSLGDPQFPNETDALAAAAESNIIREPTDVDVAEAAFVETDTGFFELQEEAAPQPDEFGFVETEGGLFVLQEEIEAQIDQEQFEDELGAEEFVPLSEIETEPESVDSPYEDEEEGTLQDLNTGERVTAGEAQADAAIAQAAVTNARNQQSIREQRGNNVDTADWRVRLRLAPNASYLYKDPEPGILQPLAVSDGVIFPYTPSIQTVYKANYTSYNLTHSNYRGFFYQGSGVEDINITGVFTAQDSVEAAYLLAVIHFFRSATKMFYGQDPQRGAPPPVVYLSAFGASQYVDAPCVIGSFNYNLPTDVDYIRAGAPNQDGTNLLKRRDRQSLPTNRFSAAIQRLNNARTGGLPRGGETFPPPPPTLGLSRPTYVPTRMEITIILHPMQSRQQVSQKFSLKEYGPGRLQPKGFW